MPSFNGEAPKKVYEPVETGEYDTILTMEWKMAGTTKTIGCTYKIRPEIPNQKFGGRYLFDTIWPDKNNSNEYDAEKINAILSTIEPEKDENTGEEIPVKTDFESYDELIQYCNGRAMIIRTYIVDKNKDDPSQGKKNAIDKYSFKPSPYPMYVNQNGQKFGEAPAEENQTKDVTADDLPF